MTTVRVKICGITNEEDAECAVSAGADALGFIFYPKSPRFIALNKAAEIVRGLPPFVTPVGVFVNESRDRLVEAIETVGFRAAQLHGDESPEHCVDLPVPVIRVLRVGDGFDPASAEPYREAGVTTFLLDTARKGMYGGTGETFDWAAATATKAYGRVILSGGMTPDNVGEGIRAVEPYAVDTGSGVEASPGKKDSEKVRAFLTAVRGAWAGSE